MHADTIICAMARWMYIIITRPIARVPPVRIAGVPACLGLLQKTHRFVECRAVALVDKQGARPDALLMQLSLSVWGHY